MTEPDTNRPPFADDDSVLTPAVDVLEDSNGITLLADLPGVSRENLRIEVEGETLRIDAEMRVAAPDGLTSTHAEVHTTRYRRKFTLSRGPRSPRRRSILWEECATPS